MNPILLVLVAAAAASADFARGVTHFAQVALLAAADGATPQGRHLPPAGPFGKVGTQTSGGGTSPTVSAPPGNSTSARKAPTDESDGPNVDNSDDLPTPVEPESARAKFFRVGLCLLLLASGGLNGYLLFLVVDFRNRYLELLRDLDASADQPETPLKDELGDDGDEADEAETDGAPGYARSTRRGARD